MEPEALQRGVVYTETLVHAAPAQLASEAPYQIAIVELSDGRRITARIQASTSEERVRIGDRVVFAESRDGVPIFRITSEQSSLLSS
jgi:uncharacterized OB-fold protein